MKTSVIDVRDMLSVLSVQGVEERIGEVPGVESVTVNHAAATATVRYDETRLHVGDIKSDVRQRGFAAASESPPKIGPESEPAGQAPLAPSQPPVLPPQKGAADAAPTQPEKDTAPSTPAATPPKDAGPGAPPEPTAAAAAAPVGEAAPPEATEAAGPDSEAPGPIEKVTAWVRETLTGGDEDTDKAKDKAEAPSSASEAEPPKASAPSPATGAAAASHAPCWSRGPRSTRRGTHDGGRHGA